ncbi:chromosome partitioning ATPase [Actibacterium atlanticum]|uniref:Chromosome partitioning ATPase n=1 Tax=Actibacterium atlanticum TaxID=1461693 RepID=A0A058ZPD8_9RHOB|nr:AAA family ATPase [Actibacterium atlanticum]KCV83090.1 chromosome partitioning ATPase [Actibacterium atlanticum]
MTSSAPEQIEPAPITACTISRDVQNFDLLIEDMETELGESWGDLSFQDAAAFLKQPDASELEFVAIAVDEQDEDIMPAIGDLIRKSKDAGIKVILIAEDVSPIALHQLLRLGADNFVPYPLPEGALHEAIENLRQPEPVVNAPALPEGTTVPELAAGGFGSGSHNGAVIPVHGIAGGVGSTTLAVNLAWELATISKEDPPKVCILDLDLQFGSVSTFLDMPRRETVYELLADIASMDSDSFRQALQVYDDKLHVLTAPADILPLDLMGGEDVQKLIETAKAHFDFVIIDMPTTLVQWTESVLGMADIYFAVMELDMRSAQNTLRLIRALKGEDLPYEKLRFVLNRAPKFTDLSGKSRVKRMAENLDIDIELQMPEGGKAIVQACDHGLPLAATSAKTPLRKEIQKLAQSMFEHAHVSDLAAAE